MSFVVIMISIIFIFVLCLLFERFFYAQQRNKIIVTKNFSNILVSNLQHFQTTQVDYQSTYNKDKLEPCICVV